MLRWFHVEPQPSGFRFLHDEISGGELALSKLRTKAAYAGKSVIFSAIEYGFVDNIVDNAAIDGALSADTSGGFIEQFGVSLDTSALQYIEATQKWGFRTRAKKTAFDTYTTDEPFTMMGVFDFTGNYISRIGIFSNALSGFGNSAFQFEFISNTQSRIICYTSNTTRVNRVYNFGPPNGSKKLIMFTYDGSLDKTGFNIYVNDMVTPLAPVSDVSNSLNLITAPREIDLGRAPFSDGLLDYYGEEFHLFDKELSVGERETAKEIFEQYYTFT